jgi:hypothetical protein
MSFEDGFEARQTIIDFDDFAGQGVKSGVHARKPVIDIREAAIDIREAIVHAGKPSHDGAVLNHAGNDVHQNREHGKAYRQIKLRISHTHSSDAKQTLSQEYLSPVAEANRSVTQVSHAPTKLQFLT